MKPQNAKTPYVIFYAIFGASLLFTTVLFCVARGAGAGFFYLDGQAPFAAFTENLHYLDGQENGPWAASFNAKLPALAYAFLALVSKVFTLGNPAAETMAYFTLALALVVLMAWGIVLVIRRFAPAPVSPWPLVLCLTFSGIFLYTIEHGSLTPAVMVLLLFAVALKDSKRPWQRELALILIATATGLAILPILFVLLYLAERHFKDALRLVTYALVLFFVPFAFFGGLPAFKQFVLNLATLGTLEHSYITLAGIGERLALRLPELAATLSLLFTAERIGMGVLLAVCVFLTRELWMRTLLICAFFVLIPGGVTEPIALVLVVPLVLFLVQSPGVGSVRRAVYAILFAGVFVLLPFGTQIFGVASLISVNMYVCFASVYALAYFAVIETIVRFVKAKVQDKMQAMAMAYSSAREEK